MANETNLEININANSVDVAADKVDAFNESLDKTDETQKKVEASTKSLSEQYNEFSSSVSNTVNMAKDAFAAFQRVSAEVGRQAGIMRNLAGSVDEANSRINGLITSIDLMEARNKFATQGLQLTAHEFANVSVAASAFAETTGENATEAMNKFGEAIAEGNAENLRKLGITITDTSSKMAIQQQALAALETQFGSTEAQINNTAEAMDAMKNSASNVITEFTKGLQTSANWDRTLKTLRDSANSVAQAFGVTMSDSFSLAEESGKGFSLMLHTTLRLLGQATNALGLFMQGKLGEAAEAFAAINIEATALQVVYEAMGNDVVNNVNAAITAATAAQGATPAASSGGTRQEAKDPFEAGMQEQSGASVIEGINAEREAQALASQERLDAQNALNEAKNQEIEIQRMQAETTRAQSELDAQRLAQQQQYVKTQDITNKGMSGFMNLAQAAGTAIAKAEGNRKKAFKEALKEWLKGFAIQQAFLGAADLAAGIAATISNPPDAAAKYISAAQHFAIAAAAGGAAGGLAAGGKSGGGGKGSEKPSTSPNNGGGGGGSSGGGGGPTTVVVNVEGTALLTEGQVGREVQNAMSAYSSRYGTTA